MKFDAKGFQEPDKTKLVEPEELDSTIKNTNLKFAKTVDLHGTKKCVIHPRKKYLHHQK